MPRFRIALEYLALAALAAALTYLLTTNLGITPGLHGDEAWFGLRANQIATGESSSIHGMNGYTGALFPYLASLSFRAFGVSVVSLRAVGVALNLAAIALFAATAWIVKGRRSVFFLLFLLGASLLVTSESRIAWEVTALGPFLVAVHVLVSASWLKSASPWPRARLGAASFTLLLFSALGAYSHFIFLAFTGALFLAALSCVIRYKTLAAAQLVITLALSVANLALFAVVKILLFRAKASPMLVLWGFLALFVAEAIAVAPVLSNPSLLPRVLGLLDRRARFFRIALKVVLGAGVLSFLGCHILAFFQMLANGVVAVRIYSAPLPTLLLALSYVYAVFLLVLYATALYRVLRGRSWRGAADPDASQYLVLVLPMCMAATLPLLIQSNSLRYYILNNVTLILGAWAAQSLLLPPSRLRILSGVGLYAALLGAAIAPIVADPHHYEARAGTRFALGYEHETSAHFLPTDRVFQQMVEDGVTEVRTNDDFFLGLPLRFYGLTRSREGTPWRTATIEYDESRPGGIAYTVDE